MQIAHVDATHEFRSLLTSSYRTIATAGSTVIPEAEAHGQLIARLVNEAVRLYTETHRDYHDIRHPINMWRVVKMLKETGQLDARVNEELLLLLILLHDVVVKLGRKHGWNEWMSAELAEQHLRQLGVRDAFVNALYYGIVCSTHHTIDPELKEYQPWIWHTIAIFLDLDLMGLGQGSKSFAMDTERVWHEYRAIVTRDEYDAGRIAWAKRFLEREAIYHTDAFQYLEAPARENLAQLAGTATFAA